MTFLSRAMFRSSLFTVFFFAMTSSVSAVTFEGDQFAGEYKDWAIETEHFRIEYSTSISEGADLDNDGVADFVENAAEYAEESWDRLMELGFPDPIAQYAAVRSDLNQEKVYFILDEVGEYLGEGTVGSTSILADGSLYMAVDATGSDGLIKVTIAHEFAHYVQFSYQGDFLGYEQDLNFAEQIAVVLEDYVYDEVNDYYSYLPDFFAYPDYSVFTGAKPANTLFEYASGIWPRFIVEELGDDWSFVFKVVDSYFREPTPDVWDAYQAYVDILTHEYDLDVRDVYQDFALANYVGVIYEEGENYPAIEIQRTHDVVDLPLERVTLPSTQWPALFGANYVQFEVDSEMRNQDFRLTIESVDEVQLGVQILQESDEVYYGSDVVKTILPAGSMSHNITVPVMDDSTILTLIITPLTEDALVAEANVADPFSTGYQYYYSAEVGDFLDRNEAVIEMIDSIDESQEEEEMEVIEEEVVQEDSGSSVTVGTVNNVRTTNVSPSAISLRWNRVMDEEVDGYVVYDRLSEGGELYVFEEISGAHITSASLDVWSDVFYLSVAPTVNGEPVETSRSEELRIETESLGSSSFELPELDVDFSDLSASHPHYVAIRFLSESAILEGYEDGTFRPGASINRAELMKILTFEDVDSLSADQLWHYQDCFEDVTNQWFAPYVCYAADQGWVSGYDDGLFHPERVVSKVESLKMILESTDIEIPESVSGRDVNYNDVFAAQWFAPYVVAGQRLGLLEETGPVYNPHNGRTRSEVSEIIFRYIVVYMMDAEAYTPEVHDLFMSQWGELFFAG